MNDTLMQIRSQNIADAVMSIRNYISCSEQLLDALRHQINYLPSIWRGYFAEEYCQMATKSVCDMHNRLFEQCKLVESILLKVEELILHKFDNEMADANITAQQLLSKDPCMIYDLVSERLNELFYEIETLNFNL